MAIRQGTTPTHTFTIPFDTSLLKIVSIAYAQNSVLLFSKRTEDVTMDGTEMRVTLSQEETLMIDPRRNVQVQVRVVTKEGEALASDIFTLSGELVLEREVLA